MSINIVNYWLVNFPYFSTCKLWAVLEIVLENVAL